MHTIDSTVQPAFVPAVLKAITAAVAATDCPTDETVHIASKQPAQYPTHTTTDDATGTEADGAAQ